VQTADVLRHDCANPASLLERGESAMAVVRLRLGEPPQPERVELPDSCRIAPKRVDVADLGNPRLGADVGGP